MLNAWRSIFGSYSPITDPITGEALNSAAGINFEYIGMIVFFTISFIWFLKFLFSLFKE